MVCRIEWLLPGVGSKFTRKIRPPWKGGAAAKNMDVFCGVSEHAKRAAETAPLHRHKEKQRELLIDPPFAEELYFPRLWYTQPVAREQLLLVVIVNPTILAFFAEEGGNLDVVVLMRREPTQSVSRKRLNVIGDVFASVRLLLNI